MNHKTFKLRNLEHSGTIEVFFTLELKESKPKDMTKPLVKEFKVYFSEFNLRLAPPSLAYSPA
jgi:hypothetical protein